MRTFVQDNADRLEPFFLPPYSPELNPDDLVWAHVKTRVAKATTQTRDELTSMVDRTLRRLQKLHDIMAGFFSVHRLFNTLQCEALLTNAFSKIR